MNLLERIPTRWLLTGAALACLALWAAPSVAQSTGNPVTGQALYDDTNNASGLNNFTNDCIGCHGPGVQNRRTVIGGSQFADISFDRAMTRLGAAIGGNLGGMSQFSRLDPQQIRDIAAYIADTPKVTATDLAADNTLAFVSTAVGNAVTKNITVQHSLTTTTTFQISSVSLAAGGSTAFTRTGTCTNLAQAGTCTFSVTYTPTNSTAVSRVLTITGQIGTVPVTRTVTLNGSIAGVVTPPPPAPTGGDNGGGALGWAWLTGLALATAVLARRRRA